MDEEYSDLEDSFYQEQEDDYLEDDHIDVEQDI